MLEAVRGWPNYRGGTEAELAAWLRQILAQAVEDLKTVVAIPRAYVSERPGRRSRDAMVLDDAVQLAAHVLTGCLDGGQESRDDEILQLPC